MKPGENVRQAIDRVAGAIAQALGTRVVCIAVYGSAASDEFAPAHSDVNLLLVLHEVAFADLRLIGATLEREATPELRIATPLVVTPHFLTDARDSFPIELDDVRARHRVLHGDDVLAGISVRPDRLREQAEREARGKLLRLRALVVHRPPDETLQLALASLVAVLGVIERALLRSTSTTQERGTTLFAEVERHAGEKLRALPGLAAMRDGRIAWPSGADLDDLLSVVLHEVERLVRYVDAAGS
jgi:predicted nucleotidyltransferase